ncbi:unnamed protein product [Cylicocyclus nassatus]|uniref:Arylesterase n=1 Tax=Cylicocyclus nassatus TaxID=53992 RepID=A0AA36GL47_CYLNA|nr:unnamed protein product [Cylicocyclus nassatus]
MIRTLLLITIFGVLAAYVFKIMLVLDVNKRVYNHRPGYCRKVDGIEHGSEDIALIEEEGIAFVTSGIYYIQPRAEYVKGRIFLYDFKQKGTFKAEPVVINGEFDRKQFHPHGISHIVTSKGVIRLFVINHSKDFKHSVLILDWNSKTRQLDLVRIIADEKFIRPNNLAAISEDAFILTNDGWAQTSTLNFLEMLSMIPTGNIVYYDGKVSSWLLPKATSPNGVAFDRERKHLFVSHFNDETVSVYEVDKGYKSLTKVANVHLLTSMDNLYVDKNGDVWTGAHPVLKDAFGHLGDCDDPSKLAPSQVLRIKFSKGFKSWEISEPFLDDGRLISASSITIPFENQLLIGSVCRELVHCYTTPETV